MQEISEEEALNLLRARVSYGRNITTLAAELGVSQAFMSAVLAGKKRMTDPMLESVGVVRKVTYLRRDHSSPISSSRSSSFPDPVTKE